MNKLLGFTLALLLLLPVAASATPIEIVPLETADTVGTISLNIDVTSVVNGYYTDYQAILNGEKVELFCVEEQSADIYHFVEYDLYKLGSTTAQPPSGSSDSDIVNQVAFLAESWYTGSYNDTSEKGQFQLGIWDILDTIGTVDITESWVDSILSQYNSNIDYTGNWLLASNADRQNYLMRAAPVPEPATLLLLGTGLIGLAGLSRKKFIS